jgi:hypothetical protein
LQHIFVMEHLVGYFFRPCHVMPTK